MTAVFVAVAVALGLSAAPPADDAGEGGIAAFLEHVSGSEAFAPEAKEFVRRAWAENQRGEALSSPRTNGDFLLESLAVLSPRFAEGLDSFEKGQTAHAQGLFSELARTDDPYLAFNAAIFELKAALENKLVPEGLTLAQWLDDNRQALRRYTFAAADAKYLLGYCYMENREYDLASETLAEFLQDFPEAPEAMRQIAGRMIERASAREDAGIEAVVELMRGAGCALGEGRVGAEVVAKQEQALELLTAMVEELKQQPQQDPSECDDPQGPQKSTGTAASYNDRPAEPLAGSRLIDGGSRPENLGGAVRAQPGQSWGNMPPLEREALLQPIRERFPTRYGDLVRQYYGELSKER